jgi:regulatory protein
MAFTVMPDDVAARAAAEIYARRKRIGVFGPSHDDAKLKQKQVAAMIRAGHSFDLAKRFVNAVSPNSESDEQ